MVRGKFSGGGAVFLGGNCPMVNCLESNCPEENFPQGQLSLGAIVFGVNCPGVIIRGAIMRGAIIRGPIFLGWNCLDTKFLIYLLEAFIITEEAVCSCFAK